MSEKTDAPDLTRLAESHAAYLAALDEYKRTKIWRVGWKAHEQFVNEAMNALPALITAARELDALRGLWTAEPPKQDGFYWWRRDFFRPGAVVQVMGDTAYYLGEKRRMPAQGGEWSGPLLPPMDDYRARAALGGGATGGGEGRGEG